MEISPLAIPGAFRCTPTQHRDDRGAFCEWYRYDLLAEAVGHPLDLAQANCSVSVRGTMRGLHFASVPPGQAKYVMCVRGAVLDAIVDLRIGSPSFGQHALVPLDDRTRTAVYLAEGLGHAFLALTDDATVVYLCSTTYAPGREHGINPLDPEIGIGWPTDHPFLLSPKDEQAPGLSAATDLGLLPAFEQCRRYTDSLDEMSRARS